MDFMDILLVLLLVWLIKQTVEFVAAYRDLVQQRDDVIKDLQQEIASIIPVKVEVHNDCYYFFHEKTNEFIVQGKCKLEVETALEARYGGEKRLAVDTDDPVIKQFIKTSEAQPQ